VIWIIALVFLLYIRTLGYHYCIDDYVERDGYLYDIPMEGPSHKFWSMKPSPWYRLFMIAMHCVNVSIIYMLWGWAPALLFAVHPMAVWGVAWVTGNYYATTTYFILISYYILHTFPNIWGTLVAMPIYAAALNSTITAIGFPFILGTMGVPLFIPLWLFLRGKRFMTGMAIRRKIAPKPVVDTSFTWRRLVLMTKVMARYIYFVFVPNKIGLFTGWGENIRKEQDAYDKMHEVNGEFWSSLALCIGVLLMGFIINPFATVWFFGLMAVHSQWGLQGQFIAQRYLYLPMIGLCVIVGTILQQYPYALTAVVTFLVIRTHLFIPAWRHQEALNMNDIENFPENPRVWVNASQYYLTQYNGRFSSLKRFHEVGSWLHRALSMGDSYPVHVNLCAWYRSCRQYDKSIEHIDKAIECIGKDNPFTPTLQKQKEELIKQGELGCSLSRLKKGRDNGQRKEKGSTEGIEHNGDSEYQGREERASECVAGV